MLQLIVVGLELVAASAVDLERVVIVAVLLHPFVAEPVVDLPLAEFLPELVVEPVVELEPFVVSTVVDLDPFVAELVVDVRLAEFLPELVPQPVFDLDPLAEVLHQPPVVLQLGVEWEEQVVEELTVVVLVEVQDDIAFRRKRKCRYSEVCIPVASVLQVLSGTVNRMSDRQVQRNYLAPNFVRAR